MKCPRCSIEVAWPPAMSEDARRAIVELAHSSRAAAHLELVRQHKLSLSAAKALVMHLPHTQDACSRCSTKRPLGQAICTKCGALSLIA